MSRRKCCCQETETGAHACYPCPDPISPYTETQWSVSVFAVGIKGESDGSGALATGGAVLDCQRGNCGSVEFKEKAVGNDTYAMGYCDPTEVCLAMHEDAAGKNYGSSQMEWTTCRGADGEEDPGTPYYPDISYTYGEHVRILKVGAQAQFNYSSSSSCGWSAATSETTDCRSYVEVQYNFTNYFEYPFFEDAGPGQHCYQNTASISTNQSWVCVYSKRPSAGQFLAEGEYNLVAVQYPTAAHTVGPVGETCSRPGGTICSANGLTPVTSPTQWQPPATVTVVRVA